MASVCYLCGMNVGTVNRTILNQPRAQNLASESWSSCPDQPSSDCSVTMLFYSQTLLFHLERLATFNLLLSKRYRLTKAVHVVTRTARRRTRYFIFDFMFACACLWRVNELFCDLIGSLKFRTDSLANTRKVSKFTRLSLPLFALLERGWVRDQVELYV